MNESPRPTGLTRTVLRGAGMAAAGYGLTQVLTLGFYLVLARLATPEDFGQLAAGSVAIGLGALAVESGLMAALIQRRDRIEEAASTAVVATLVSGVVLSLVALALSPLIGSLFDSDTIAAVAAAMAGVLFLRAVPLVPEALLQRRFAFARRLVVEPAAAVAFGVVAVIATSDGMGVWGLVLGTYAAAITEVILSWAFVRWLPRRRHVSFAMWRELIGFGRHVFVGASILRVGEQIPVVLLGRFVGPGALGQFRYSERVASLPYAAVLATASYVIFPAFARISDDPPRMRDATLRSLRWMSAIAVPGGLMLVPFGIPLVVLVFGEVWRPAGEAVVALSLFTAANALVSVVCESFKASGRPDLLVQVHLLTTVATLAFGIPLLAFELIGVAAALSLAVAVTAAYCLALLRSVQSIPIRESAAEVLPFALASLVMAAVATPAAALVDPAAMGTVEGLLVLVGLALAATAVYCVVLRILVPGIVGELRSLASTARRREEAPAQEAAALATLAEDEEMLKGRQP